MIRVIVISNLRLAQAFVDYMATCQVTLTINHNSQHTEIWLNDDEQLPHVQHELEQFLREPLHSRYQAASWQAGKFHSELHYQRFPYLRTILSQAGSLTLSVMILCIAIYLWMQIVGYSAVMLWLAWPQDSNQYWQLWRWVSHAFLHFSLLHILFNLMWWWYLGGQIERQLGTSKLIVLAIVSAVFSGWAQSLISGVNFGGLSGVVYALMGYAWLATERTPERGIILPRGLMVFSVLWLAAGYFDFLGLSIANAAHISGLVIGLLMGFWDTRRSARTKQ